MSLQSAILKPGKRGPTPEEFRQTEREGARLDPALSGEEDNSGEDEGGNPTVPPAPALRIVRFFFFPSSIVGV
jgi:hypothetical protein